jgi:hypothetical protein
MIEEQIPHCVRNDKSWSLVVEMPCEAGDGQAGMGFFASLRMTIFI